jgi:hypothetical protein
MRKYVIRSMLAVLLCCAAAGPAAGSDPRHGADADWLPNEEWVLEHWIPYDQGRLTRLLETDIAGLQEWMRGDRPLAGLVRLRGFTPSRLARLLVAPWRGRVSDQQRLELQRRALETLTQGHLALHLFFHPTHSRSLNRLYAQLHGGHPAAHAGHSLLEITRAQGRSARWLRRETLRLVRRSARRGVRLEATSREQARRWLRYQEPAALEWLEWRPGGQREASGSQVVGASIASVLRSAAARIAGPAIWRALR